MQDKLIITYLSRDKNNIFEIDLNNLKENKILFAFNEYEDVAIRLASDIYNVKIECISYLDENNKYVALEDNLLYLHNGVDYIISKNGNFDIGYNPSQYHIIISDSLKEYDCFFNVEFNHQISEDGMNNIIESINKFISGLTIDFFKNQHINGISNIFDENEFYIYEILEKYHLKLSVICDRIISSLRMNISGTIVNSNYEKKQNSKSLRKNLTKFNSIYSVRKDQTANNKNNIILKKYLMKILFLIEKSKEGLNLNEIIEDIDLEIMSITNNILIEEENSTKKNANFNKMIIENHIKSLKNEKRVKMQWKQKLINWQESYNKVYFSLKKILNINEIKVLNTNNQIQYSFDFYANNEYKFISDLYSLLFTKISYTEKNGKSNIFSRKKSYEIFEIYGFIIIQNIIKEIGFNYMSNKNNTIFDFYSGAEFQYVLGNKKIIVKYDYYCEKYNNSLEGNVVNINSKNCKPDYIILFYEDEKIKNIVVVEMKYRNLKYLIDFDGGSTETDITLEDYSQLGFLKYKRKIPERLVRNVLLLFPSKDELCFDRNMANYIGLNSNINFDESKSYSFIKNIIIDNI